jgi:membrane-associated phospholipid phosphatase
MSINRLLSCVFRILYSVFCISSLLFFLAISISTNLFAQEVVEIKDSAINKTHIDYAYPKPQWLGKTFLQDQAHIWTSPLRIKKKDLHYLIPLSLATAIIMVFDEDINQKTQQFKNNNQWVKNLSPILTDGGEIPVVGGISAAMYITGLAIKDDKLMQTGAIAGYALVNAAVVVTVLKMIAGRQRPRVDGTSNWKPFPQTLEQFNGTSSDYYASFPSGHSIAAWTLATVVAEQYKETKVIPILMYTFATGVALSRTTENAHWLSDAIVGSALGFGIGKYLAKKHKSTKWFLFPSQSGGSLMVTGIYRL